ncbi:uncharacterized protein L201_000268 [Kwoniella dendrophila CBS 6074]|uniref:Cyclin-like domain-containing protein n=1 Tax=Kwoniella dendrophila CBS 6074 TaxID=1295534 RepID=A0AAX4JJ09_9TREE
MSSSFWSSSHCLHWLTTRPNLIKSRELDLKYCQQNNHNSKHLYILLNIFLIQLIQKLGKRLLLRQIPISTACIFFKRFYLKNNLCETNPYLVLAACLFVAAKVEETPVHIKSVVSEAKVVFNEYNIKMFPAETNKLGEMEFYLMEDLDFHLIIFHPYRSLLHITGREPADSGKFPLSRVEEDQVIKKKEIEVKRKKDDEIRKSNLASSNNNRSVTPTTTMSNNTIKDVDESDEIASESKRIRRLMSRGSTEGIGEIDEGVLQISWFILNDTYRTDVHLLYPPYVISISAVYIAFCLTSMNSSNNSSNSNNNNSTQRTRQNSSSSGSTNSNSTQLHSIQQSINTNEQLGLNKPPNSASEFLSGFQINLTILFSCIQDIISLYSIWESFEPSSISRHHQQQQQQQQNQIRSTLSNVNGDAKEEAKKEKFGPEEAEHLIRKMIESRIIDMGHPNNAGINQTSKRALPNASSINNNSMDNLAGVSKKRARK